MKYNLIPLKMKKKTLDELKHYWDSEHDTHIALFDEAEQKAQSLIKPLGGYFEDDGRNHHPAPYESEEYNKLVEGEQKERENAKKSAQISVKKRIIRDLRSLICNKWNYCSKRNQYSGDGFNLAIAICDTATSSALVFPFPITAAIVYIIRNHGIDKLCKCNQE